MGNWDNLNSINTDNFVYAIHSENCTAAELNISDTYASFL